MFLGRFVARKSSYSGKGMNLYCGKPSLNKRSSLLTVWSNFPHNRTISLPWNIFIDFCGYFLLWEMI
jgi:hypothetical protein